MVVTTAHVGGNGEVGRTAFEREIVHAEVHFLKLLAVVGRTYHLLPKLRVAHHAPRTVVELNVTATCVVKVADHLTVSLGDVLDEFFGVGVEALGIERIVATEKFCVELCRSGNGLLGHYAFAFKLLDELVVLHKGMVLSAKFAGKFE